jgi:hypothetical protein
MTPTFQSKPWLFVFIFGVVIAGCDCGKPPVKQVNKCSGVAGVQADMLQTCSTSTECSDHFSCRALKDQPDLQCCLFTDRQCNTEADCCPGQTCPTNRKECLDKFLECSVDEDCGDRQDRFCEQYTDTYGTTGRCRFRACTATGSCPSGQSCFNGECMAELPCGGFCEPGKACVPTSNQCQNYTLPTGREMAACPVTCKSGYIATFQDPKNIWDSCTLPTVKCVCSELPSLHSEDLGRYSSLAASANQGLFVSAYDGQYGDLVVYRFDGTGAPLGLDYVDGVPAAMAKYGPSGARGGVIEPGDDVGRYTDVVSSSERVYVSYYDVTHGDLKMARRDPNGIWNLHTIDGSTANVGLYSSVALDADGYPAVAYFQKGGDDAFDPATCPAPVPTGPKAFITALKVAHASTVVPGPNDWLITTVACQSRPTPACYNCGNVCADPGTGPECLVADATCTGCDPNTEQCVIAGGAPKCAKKYNPSTLNEIGDGVGLFSSLAINGKDAYVAFMKRTTPTPMGSSKPPADGDLFGVRVTVAGQAGPLVLLDGSGDTGYFPDTKIDPSSRGVAVAYHDFSSKKLKFYLAPEFQTGVVPEVIDTGAGTAGSGEASWVGTDSSIVFSPIPGQLFAVYQDATRGDLKMAKRETAWQVLPPVVTNGAVGFFADGAFSNGKIFASHARIHARLIAGEPHVDNSLLLEAITP